VDCLTLFWPKVREEVFFFENTRLTKKWFNFPIPHEAFLGDENFLFDNALITELEGQCKTVPVSWNPMGHTGLFQWMGSSPMIQTL
jgi:hypothetical protein